MYYPQLKGHSCACAIDANFSISNTSIVGFDNVSPNIHLVFSLNAALISSTDASWLIKSHQHPSSS